MVVCGRVSGRDGDKDQKAGITPVFAEKAPYYEEARLVLICRKLYRQEMDPSCFLDPSILTSSYPQKDFTLRLWGPLKKYWSKTNKSKNAQGPFIFVQKGHYA